MIRSLCAHASPSGSRARLPEAADRASIRSVSLFLSNANVDECSESIRLAKVRVNTSTTTTTLATANKINYIFHLAHLASQPLAWPQIRARLIRGAEKCNTCSSTLALPFFVATRDTFASAGGHASRWAQLEIN